MSLVQSILNQNVQAVAHHLQRPTDLNFIDDYGFTPLIEAAIVNNVEIVTMLLQHGADPNFEDEKGGTALHWATENNNHHIAKILLSSGANPNIYNTNSQSPLVIPVLRKQTKMKQLLYHYKASLSFAQDFINTKLLGHRFQLVGKVDLIDHQKKFTEVNLEGFILEFTLDIICNSLNEFRTNFGSRKLRDYHKQIQFIGDTLNLANHLIRYQQYLIDIRQYKDKIDVLLDKELLILPVAYEGHAITFVRYGDILVKCDRQNDHGTNDHIVFYQMANPAQFSLSFIKGLLYRKNPTEYIKDYLPQKLGLRVLDKLEIPAQISGNCSWANVEATIPAVLYLILQEQNPLERAKNKNTAMMIFNAWQRWDQDRALHFCIQSFHQDNAVNKAVKAELLGMILVQSCDYNNPEDLMRAQKIMEVLTIPRYEYILKNLIKIYCFASKTDLGDNLANILEYFNYQY